MLALMFTDEIRRIWIPLLWQMAPMTPVAKEICLTLQYKTNRMTVVISNGVN
jgi:hypothetical protein